MLEMCSPWAASGLFMNRQERGAHSQVQLPLKVSFKKVGLFLFTQVGKFSLMI